MKSQLCRIACITPKLSVQEAEGQESFQYLVGKVGLAGDIGVAHEVGVECVVWVVHAQRGVLDRLRDALDLYSGN